MEPKEFKADVSDQAQLGVKYSGSALLEGAMDVADFVPALAALRRTIILSSSDLNNGTVEARVLISAEMRVGSFEFFVSLIQAASADPTLLTLRTALDVSKAVFGEKGLVGLLKFLRGADEREVQETKLDNGSVQYSVSGTGNTVSNTVNNFFVTSSDVAELFHRKDIRDSLWPAVVPVTKDGIAEVSFTTPNDSSRIQTEEARAFVPSALPSGLTDDSFTTTEQVVEVIKPSFDAHKRWKLGLGTDVFGAIMSDAIFQAKVQRRDVLFGTGDKLRILLSVRKHQKDPTEYFVAKVLAVIRPAQQLNLQGDDL